MPCTYSDESDESDSQRRMEEILFDQKLFSKVSLTLIDILGRSYTQTFHTRELSRTLGYSPAAISINLKVLEKNKLIQHEKIGNLVLYQADMDNALLRQFKILFNILELNSLAAELRGSVKKLILYGSCARGDDTYESDIDLFVEAINKDKVRSIVDENRDKIRREVSLILNTTEETATLKLKDKLLWDNIQAGIILIS
jgi:predicted nucleotidyltransferase